MYHKFESKIGNNQKLRYSELVKKLGEISLKTLADRLNELEKAKLIKRESFAEILPRVEYSLTKEGIELRNAIIPLMKWVSLRDLHKYFLQVHWLDIQFTIPIIIDSCTPSFCKKTKTFADHLSQAGPQVKSKS